MKRIFRIYSSRKDAKTQRNATLLDKINLCSTPLNSVHAIHLERTKNKQHDPLLRGLAALRDNQTTSEQSEPALCASAPLRENKMISEQNQNHYSVASVRSVRINKKIKGLTLMEVLIVLVILGIIAMIALPNYSGNVSKAKATEAKLQLGHVHTLQKEYFYQYSKYSADATELGYEQEKLANEGGTANYKVEIVEASANSFKARATAAVDFDQDGQINVWEIDHEKKLTEVTKD